jgi:hypothetical protein
MLTIAREGIFVVAMRRGPLYATPSEERGEMHHQKNDEKGKLTGSLVPAAMLAPAKSSITELTLVLLLGSQRRLSHC